MIRAQNSTLKSIIESSQGLHLTAYFENTDNLEHLKSQIQESIDVAQAYLANVQTKEETIKFLAPINQLLNDEFMLQSFRNNIGVFRTTTSFRIINLPIKVEHICIVATSFHVKPILRWLQSDHEFILVGLENNRVHIYRGNLNKLDHIETGFLSDPSDDKNNFNSYHNAIKINKQFRHPSTSCLWLELWLQKEVQNKNLKIYFAGEPALSKTLIKMFKHFDVHNKVVSPRFNSDLTFKIAKEIRHLIQHETKDILQKALIEFNWAEHMNLTKKNIFQIAKAAVQGKIKKLIIADGINIFGKLDSKTGGLSINPADLDHEDDDLLDDLAQTVIRHGGEVIVAQREEIPKGRPILAILDSKNKDKKSILFDYQDITNPKLRRTI